MIRSSGLLFLANFVGFVVVLGSYYLLKIRYLESILVIFVFANLISNVTVSVLDAGISKFISRQVALGLDGNLGAIRATFLIYAIISALIGFIFIYFYLDVITIWFEHYSGIEVYGSFIYQAFFLIIPVNVFSTWLSAVVFGSASNGAKFLYSISNGFLSYIPFLVSLALYSDHDIVGTFLLLGRIGHLIISMLIFRHYKFQKYLSVKFLISDVVSLVDPIKKLSLPAILNAFIKNSDRLVVSIVANTDFFVIYEVAMQLHQRASMPVLAYANIVYRNIVHESKAICAGRAADIYMRLYDEVKLYVLALCLIYPLALFATLSWFFEFSLGPIFYALIISLSVSLYLNSVARLLSNIVLAYGKLDIYRKISVQLASMTVLSLIMLWVIGLWLVVFHVIFVQFAGYIIYDRNIKLI